MQVPYREKDQAKALGAKWNFREKYWYCDGELTEGLRRWYVEEENETDSGMPNAHEIPVVPARSDGNGRSAGSDMTEGNMTGTWTGAGMTADNLTGISPASVGTGSSLTVSPSERRGRIHLPDHRYKTVSQVNAMILSRFSLTEEFQNIMVVGEVTNYSGHKGQNYYFAIKDRESLLPCFMWESTAETALTFELKAGQQVAITGHLDYYKAGGKSQLVVRQIMEIGAGAANLAYLQLKAKLEAEGLFDIAHKKPIPKHPKMVGIITSKDGQAIKDICKVASKRNPYIQLILYHVNVQGKNAIPSILQGIKILDDYGVDSIIIGRGGGSDEELMSYNDESIARAVYGAKTPIVSAVGHEGHWTLIDYVSDKRVATPSEAAEETVPNIMIDVERVANLKRSMTVNMKNRLEQRRLMLSAKVSALERYSPERRLQERKDRLEVLSEQMKSNMQKALDNRKHRYELLVTRLNGLSPTAKLVKGFGYISRDAQPVVSADLVHVDDELKIVIHDGEIQAKVTGVEKKGITS